MKALVLLNDNAGTLEGMQPQDARRRIADAFAFAGAEAEVRIIDMKWVQKHADEGTDGDFDAVIAAGEDGTLNSIANAVVAAGRKPLGVLPLGTVNHFAEELGVPLDLNQAAAALAKGSVTEIPVVELNGRIFLNFSAIGLASPVQSVRLSTRGRTIVAQTSSFIVCNNQHQMKAFGIEAAPVPERGLLNVYVATGPRPSNIVSQLLRGILGRRERNAAGFQSMALPELRVDVRRNRKIPVSIDGEVVTIRPPLHYLVRPAMLRVLVPSPRRGEG